MFNPKSAAKAQEAYCDEHEIPMFAPISGICPRCGYNIYLPTNDVRGSIHVISVESAGDHQITSCPHCRYSFCE